MVLPAKPEFVLLEFLPFFMQSEMFMKRAVSISVGSLSPTIDWKTMAAQEFALPLLEKQRRAVTLLNEFESSANCHEYVMDAATTSMQSLHTDTARRAQRGSP